MALAKELIDTILEADRSGVRLEMVAGVPTWETMPGRRHQEEVVRIHDSIRRLPGHEGDCGCYRYLDLTVLFADGSWKRPDLSVFCREPEAEGLVTLLPEAVVEIVSPRYEAKDLVMGIPFYLSQGVKDVVVYDPRTLAVVHARREGARTLLSRATIELECGCVCVV